jgi:hypothetical protein
MITPSRLRLPPLSLELENIAACKALLAGTHSLSRTHPARSHHHRRRVPRVFHQFQPNFHHVFARSVDSERAQLPARHPASPARLQRTRPAAPTQAQQDHRRWNSAHNRDCAHEWKRKCDHERPRRSQQRRELARPSRHACPREEDAAEARGAEGRQRPVSGMRRQVRCCCSSLTKAARRRRMPTTVSRS